MNKKNFEEDIIDIGYDYSRYLDDIIFDRATFVEGVDAKTFVEIAPRYGKDKNSVFHMEKKIEGADTETFKVLGGGYAVDKNRAYILGEPFKTTSVDLETLVPIRPFGVYRAFYAKDKNIVFIGDEPIENSDPDSFSVLGCGLYAKDKNHVYYKGKEVNGADISSFIAFNDRNGFSSVEEYAKDKNRFYYKGEPSSEEEVDRAIDEEQKRLKKYET